MTQNLPKSTIYTPRFLILALATLLAVVLTAFAGSGLAARRRQARSPTRSWITLRAWRSGRACLVGAGLCYSRATTTSALAR